MNKTSFLLLAFAFTSLNALSQRYYSIVSGNNAFALDFYLECSKSKNENIFISPFSISTALAMTYTGAKGVTAAEMMTAMGFIKSTEKQNSEYSYLISDLTEPGSPLIISNTLWAQIGKEFETDFLNTNSIYFGGNFREVNFGSDRTRQEINDTIEQQTQSKIKDLLPDGSIDSDTRLILTNAIYFKDSWAQTFKKELTKPRDFFITPDQVVNTMFMEQKGGFNYFENDLVSILELPYKNKYFSMLIFLPKENVDIADFEKSFSIENYNSWTLSKSSLTKIQIPRFKIEQETDPVQILKNFGMVEAFIPDRANFSGMTKENLYISGIFHKAFIEVNEEGTEAAAATGVVIATRGAAPKEYEFIANRPFVFIIRAVVSESILFIGKLHSPPATK